MQRGRGLPAHPSLPPPPHQNPQSHANSSYPQSQYYQNVSSHYAQAYMQYNPAASTSYWPQTTPEGYASSSSYLGTSAGTTPAQIVPKSVPAPWYQPGGCKCSKQGCSFVGSQKAVEIHMMDRHLIYPPGWEKRKRRQEWDADPSLKGKPVLIQGTNVKLDTPEAIEQWIAERKKRFPTAERVVEKRKRIEEAAARGQLPLQEERFPWNKRRRLDAHPGGGDRGRRGGRGQRGRGRGRGWGADRVAGSTRKDLAPNAGDVRSINDEGQSGLPKEGVPKVDVPADDVDGSHSESDSDAPPEIVSSKAAPQQTVLGETERNQDNEPEGNASHVLNLTELNPPKKPSVRQPKRPPHNPFSSRPALLRNLLLPEIRMTVSNLSQAIRFLVDNDFLDNVELKPGQANEKMIEVMDEGVNTENDQTSEHNSRVP